jgi:hypothetical protein
MIVWKKTKTLCGTVHQTQTVAGMFGRVSGERGNYSAFGGHLFDSENHEIATLKEAKKVAERELEWALLGMRDDAADTMRQCERALREIGAAQGKPVGLTVEISSGGRK